MASMLGAPDTSAQTQLRLARGPEPVPETAHQRFPTAPVLAPPHAEPHIYSVKVAPAEVRPGELVVGTVTTTSNVASVVATVRGLTVTVPRVGVGRFALAYRMPDAIPPFLDGTYALTVIARNADGVAATQSVPITLR
jgi:hypothetical protein